MNNTQNITYFEEQLLATNPGDHPAINQLISDMVNYAKSLSTIPPGESVPPKTKPGGLLSPVFRIQIDQYAGQMEAALFELLENFLEYIISLEKE